MLGPWLVSLHRIVIAHACYTLAVSTLCIFFTSLITRPASRPPVVSWRTTRDDRYRWSSLGRPPGTTTISGRLLVRRPRTTAISGRLLADDPRRPPTHHDDHVLAIMYLRRSFLPL